MITMQELLKDKAFRKFMLTQPRTPVSARSSNLTPQWVVYVQLEPDRPWKRKAFDRYTDAFKFMKRCLQKNVYDVAINNKRVAFDPPNRLVRIKGKYIVGADGERRQATKLVEWKPRLTGEDPDHDWCMYCRRPVVYKRFRKHPAFERNRPASLWDVPLDDSCLRCCICGASERIAVPLLRRRGW